MSRRKREKTAPVSEEDAAVTRWRAERVFQEVRRGVIGKMRHNVILELREPDAAAYKHLWLAREEIVAGLRTRGHSVPDDFDPFVMAEAAQRRRALASAS